VPLLPHEERILEAYNAFSIHRLNIINEYWSEEEFISLRNNPAINCWSSGDQILERLWRKLPFGQHITAEHYNRIIADLHLLTNDAKEQLFYWHTAGPIGSRNNEPVQSVTIFTDPNFLWFHHIAPIRQHIKNLLEQGERVRYLESFRLDYEHVHLHFTEIRSTPVRFGSTPTTPNAVLLVTTPGREHTFRWNTNFWEVNLDNPDRSLTNPVEYRFAPAAPLDSSRSSEYREARERPVPQVPLIQRISLEEFGRPDNSNASSTPATDERYPSCWCGVDSCTCNHRPDTPPTPPGITLWKPGDNQLPNISI
jgi:hypothetical protein